ncbi:hypothetical protein Pan216_25530 [Planctomycetes bacterium Pan216]|uniref:Reverse transcriptase (RNA-dependent DNA polymerase) n=1 Tax=Kolteria novifilia TaxID=2527975 RepID=A0A518B3X0_9BACT|nr:hypothetical protein Pan216_25530 [Planctomycetes bacterium Pan216]
MVYTRFVDDITITSAFDLEETSYPQLIFRIMGQLGFRLGKHKTSFGRLDDGFEITSLCIENGELDVRREYLEEFELYLRDAELLAVGKDPLHGYRTQCQLSGQLHFIAWVRPKRKRGLIRRFKAIKWDEAHKNAVAKGLFAIRPTITMTPSPPPEWEKSFQNSSP